MTNWSRVSWLEAEPRRLAIELEAMPVVAPDLAWTGTGWSGLAPTWPFERPTPAGLDTFLAGRRLSLEIAYPESFPMVSPQFIPLDPQPDLRVRTMHAWHVNGDGSLCLFQSSYDWSPASTAADLIPKASGWFLEYLLLIDGRIENMTVSGIANDDRLDHLLLKP